MRKLILCLFIITACTKNSDAPTNYSGTYKGDISTYINDISFGTLNDHTIIISSTGTSGEVSLVNNVMLSTKANISGSTLTISRATVSSSAYFDVVEYGTGAFTNNSLTIDFHQDQIAPDGSVIAKGKWTGVLTKQ